MYNNCWVTLKTIPGEVDKVGILVGLLEGCLVGVFDGFVEGIKEGMPDGCDNGDFEGYIEGRPEGSVVGCAEEGWLVGRPLGVEEVGLVRVGYSEGVLVLGCKEGAMLLGKQEGVPEEGVDVGSIVGSAVGTAKQTFISVEVKLVLNTWPTGHGKTGLPIA